MGQYVSGFSNFHHFTATAKMHGSIVLEATEILTEPPPFEHLRERIRNFTVFERWRGNIGVSIRGAISGTWKALQILHRCLKATKILDDPEIILEMKIADRVNVSSAKIMLPLQYRAMATLYNFWTELDAAGYPIHGIEVYMGNGCFSFLNGKAHVFSGALRRSRIYLSFFYPLYRWGFVPFFSGSWGFRKNSLFPFDRLGSMVRLPLSFQTR